MVVHASISDEWPVVRVIGTNFIQWRVHISKTCSIRGYHVCGTPFSDHRYWLVDGQVAVLCPSDAVPPAAARPEWARRCRAGRRPGFLWICSRLRRVLPLSLLAMQGRLLPALMRRVQPLSLGALQRRASGRFVSNTTGSTGQGRSAGPLVLRCTP